MKNFDILQFINQNIDKRGSFYGYPQSMFWTINKKNVYPCKSPFNLYKSGVHEGIYFTYMFSPCKNTALLKCMFVPIILCSQESAAAQW